ncbi:MAG: ATP-binding protein [Bacilli bacterium]|nr:ATP-binding protein [Bacilli bacterium]
MHDFINTNNNNEENGKIWRLVLEKAKKHNNLLSFLLKNSKILKIQNSQISVIVETKIAKQILTTDYYDDISNLINEVLNLNNESSKKTTFKIFFLTNDEIPKKQETDEKLPAKKNIKLFEDVCLNKNYTFDNFIVGPFNKDAYKAALLIIQKKVTQFNNPLFIYSDSGLGKTHLLNAIGNEIQKNSNLNILYTTTNDFFNEYIHIIKGEREENQIMDFFKNIDVLLIDDIQFCSKKPKFQELFFNIFSTLLNKNKPVIIASDRHPAEIIDLENRLMTRFLGGLTLPITTPDFNSNIEIIKKYIKNNEINEKNIDNKVCELIAEKFSKNIRELKGAINNFIFFGMQNLNGINDNGNILENSETKRKISEITSIIEKYFSIPNFQTAINKKKKRNIIFIEHIRIFLIKSLLSISFRDISREINKKYTTVFSAYKDINDKVKKDNEIKTTIEKLKKIFLKQELHRNRTNNVSELSQKTKIIYDKLKEHIPKLKQNLITKTDLCKKFNISKNTLNKCIKFYNKEEFDKISI